MDKIIFVDDGKIVAVGNHEQLIETCPDYKVMVELQKLEEEKVWQQDRSILKLM